MMKDVYLGRRRRDAALPVNVAAMVNIHDNYDKNPVMDFVNDAPVPRPDPPQVILSPQLQTPARARVSGEGLNLFFGAPSYVRGRVFQALFGVASNTDFIDARRLLWRFHR
jgi:hypothetical protein